MKQQRNPILMGQAEIVDMLRPEVRAMIENEGVYIGGDTKEPELDVILVSMGGKIYSMQIDQELDPERFIDTMTLKGPFRNEST